MAIIGFVGARPEHRVRDTDLHNYEALKRMLEGRGHTVVDITNLGRVVLAEESIVTMRGLVGELTVFSPDIEWALNTARQQNIPTLAASFTEFPTLQGEATGLSGGSALFYSYNNLTGAERMISSFEQRLAAAAIEAAQADPTN